MKKIIILLLEISLMFLICSCNQTSTALDNISKEKVKENIENVKNEDPYDVLKIEEYQLENFKRYIKYFIKRENNYYSLGEVFDRQKGNKYNCGWLLEDAKYNQWIISGFFRKYVDNIIGIVGDIPINKVEDTDQLISFDITTLDIYPVEFLMHSYRMFIGETIYDNDVLYIANSSNKEVEKFNLYEISNFVITDKNGVEIQIDLKDKEIINNFMFPNNKNEIVQVSFFTGTTYHEYEMKADVSWCRIANEKRKIQLKGELHKEGYASYDISNLPSGLYYTRLGGLFYK